MKPSVKDLPDLSDTWAARLERVRRSQARTNTSGMTRPPRDPVEREFLEETGQLGPFVESTASKRTVQP
jgi:hypothetical protein